MQKEARYLRQGEVEDESDVSESDAAFGDVRCKDDFQTAGPRLGLGLSQVSCVCVAMNGKDDYVQVPCRLPSTAGSPCTVSSSAAFLLSSVKRLSLHSLNFGVQDASHALDLRLP